MTATIVDIQDQRSAWEEDMLFRYYTAAGKQPEALYCTNTEALDEYRAFNLDAAIRERESLSDSKMTWQGGSAR